MQIANSKNQNQNQNQKVEIELKYRAFYLSVAVIRFLGSVPKDQAIQIISGQLIRSITSIGANIVEAKASSSKKEFINYFQISLKSANETKYWLAMLEELLPQKKSVLDEFIKEVDEMAKIIGSSVLTMKGKRTSKGEYMYLLFDLLSLILFVRGGEGSVVLIYGRLDTHTRAF